MRILFIHNKYQYLGGEDAALQQEIRSLKETDCVVDLEEFDNKGIHSPLQKFTTAVNSAFSQTAYKKIYERVISHSYDIVHIHNFWPIATVSTHAAAKNAGAAVVQTLHNYRLLCANGLFLRKNQICEDCLLKGRIQAIRHRCYKNSYIGSLSVTLMQRRAMDQSEIIRNTDTFVALNEFSKQKFIQNGIPEHKITIKNNSTHIQEGCISVSDGAFLFAGRLSFEKGVHLYIKLARMLPATKFFIAGDGPELNKIKEMLPGNCKYLGNLSQQELREVLRRSEALIIPSIWYEGQPMIAIEALEAGTPIIASNIGALPEIVTHGYNGRLFQPNNIYSLHDEVSTFISTPTFKRQQMRERSRERAIAKFSNEAAAKKLLEIYESTLTKKGVNRSRGKG